MQGESHCSHTNTDPDAGARCHFKIIIINICNENPENPRAVTQCPSINQASPQGGKCPLRAVAPAAEASEQCADMQELRVHWILAVGPGLKQQILYKQIMYKEPRKKKMKMLSS